jgi:hypothetical protein
MPLASTDRNCPRHVSFVSDRGRQVADGGLADLLRNRFYIGEVVCHGEKPIISPQKSGLFAVGASE